MTDDKDSGSAGYKVLATLAGVAGAFIARKALHASWKAATGKEPPANPEHPEVQWAEAVAWAALSGAVIGLVRMLAQRKVAASWHRATGVLPSNVEESAA